MLEGPCLSLLLLSRTNIMLLICNIQQGNGRKSVILINFADISSDHSVTIATTIAQTISFLLQKLGVSNGCIVSPR